ncbi:MAG: hypothetical protein RL367_1607 [Pseudomonadota bacterium]
MGMAALVEDADRILDLAIDPGRGAVWSRLGAAAHNLVKRLIEGGDIALRFQCFGQRT